MQREATAAAAATTAGRWCPARILCAAAGIKHGATAVGGRKQGIHPWAQGQRVLQAFAMQMGSVGGWHMHSHLSQVVKQLPAFQGHHSMCDISMAL